MLCKTLFDSCLMKAENSRLSPEQLEKHIQGGGGHEDETGTYIKNIGGSNLM